MKNEGVNVMKSGDIMPRKFLKLPVLSIPSWVEDIEEMLPMNHLINGLSVSEDEKNIYVEAALPGIEPKDVDVTFERGVLIIRGEKREEEKGKKYERRATNSFFYKVTPSSVDSKVKPEAVCKNGMVMITLPKINEKKVKKILVKAG